MIFSEETKKDIKDKLTINDNNKSVIFDNITLNINENKCNES